MSKHPTLNKCAQICALFLILLNFCACSEERPTNRPYSLLRDVAFQEMADAVDHRNASAFLPFLTHENPTIQSLAVQHAASLLDSTITPTLFDLKTPEAVYAIGQQRSASNLPGLYEIVMLQSDADLVASAMIAIAKSSDSTQLNNLIPFIQESCEINGMWAAFHAIPSGAHLQPLVPVAFHQLTCSKVDFRLAAAHFLSRSKTLDLAPFSDELFDAWNAEQQIDVKIALSLAFRNCPSTETAGFLNRELLVQGDERVRINLLRSAVSLNVCDENTLIELLKDDGVGLASLAGTTLGEIGWTEDNDHKLRTLQLSFEGDLARKNAFLMHAANDQPTYEALIQMASAEQDMYRKAAIISVLSHSPLGAEYISLQLDPTLPYVIQTTAMEALFHMKTNDILPRDFNFNAVLIQGISTEDEGVLASIGAYLQSESSEAFSELEPLLREQLSLLEIPKEVETYNELARAINHLYHDSLETITPDFNHPINWKLLGEYADTITCELQTSAGPVRLELYPTMAPGSVGSFIELALEGFYDGKFYHRVVPNFVVQAGCPRGDGWGGVDYSIRSELAIESYTTGSVGMASAGRDTESCQWFITHSPTPHLDGRYSIFGNVIAGMETVRQTNVGTQINKITIQ